MFDFEITLRDGRVLFFEFVNRIYMKKDLLFVICDIYSDSIPIKDIWTIKGAKIV